jgi:hypothetical protein
MIHFDGGSAPARRRPPRGSLLGLRSRTAWRHVRRPRHRSRVGLHARLGPRARERPRATTRRAAPRSCARRSRADGRSRSVRTISTWTMTCQVAERYRQGRVFLAGDCRAPLSAHRRLGLNTGVQDAHNLAWKLAAVEAARARLLDSYEAERRPVAETTPNRACRTRLRLFEVPRALGFTARIPKPRAAASPRLTTADRARERRPPRSPRQAEHFDMLGLQLGFTYERRDRLPDGTARSRRSPTRCASSCLEPPRRAPGTWVGRALRRQDLDSRPDPARPVHAGRWSRRRCVARRGAAGRSAAGDRALG